MWANKPNRKPNLTRSEVQLAYDVAALASADRGGALPEKLEKLMRKLVKMGAKP